MPIRIYALAKELKVDSKDLVDVCAKAGINGKGSALASLDDDEVAKVRSFLSGPKSSKEAKKPRTAEKAAGPTPFTRDDYIAPAASKSIKVLGAGKSSTPKKEVVAESVEDDEKPQPAETPPPAKTQPADTPQPPVKAQPPNKLQPPERPPLKDRGDTKKPDPPPKRSPPKRRQPVINVAPLPSVKQPSPSQPKSNEPAPQKPEIRLPKDAIAGRKKGDDRALEEHVAKSERKVEPKPSKTTGKGKAETSEANKAGLSGHVRRRSKKAGEEESDKKTGLPGMSSLRKDRQSARKRRVRSDRDDGGGYDRRQNRRLTRRGGVNTAAPRKGNVALELPCTVRSFSEAAGVSSAEVIKCLMQMGQMVTINAQIEDDLVEMLAAELGVELDIKQQASIDEQLEALAAIEDEPDSLEPRPPVVTFLGHVDHGKTSLLDYLIGTNVVSGEAGGITQHIRAYQVKKDGRAVSFVDTPGHEAFTEMRARGANVTDVAVLVIAADDGIMPQTEEAISHAKAAGVPMVVALNKMDLPGADATKAMTQMTEHELTPSEWGGDIEVMRTSAITGDGMDELLDTLLTIADMNEYTANPHRDAIGVCLESEQEGGRGVVAKVIVKNGTLNVGDIVVCGAAHGRVKAMYDTLRPRVKVKSAGPSMPVNITGLDVAPEAGERLYVLHDIAKARQIAADRAEQHRERRVIGNTTKTSFERFQQLLEEGRLGHVEDIVDLKLIIRADVRGSIEAIQKELGKLEHPEVKITILQASVGGITAADVTLADASEAVIVGFNVIPDEAARTMAEEREVEIRRYDIIYKVTDDIRALLEGRLKPEERIVELGRALVKQVFAISRVGAVAGCYVAQGSIQRGCRIRVNRDGRTIGDYPLDSLRHVKEDVKEVPRGMECGIRLSGFNDVKQDDILEAYKIEEVARTL